MNNLTPQYITDLLKPVAETYNRTQGTLVNGALAVPRFRSSLFDRSYSNKIDRVLKIAGK